MIPSMMLWKNARSPLSDALDLSRSVLILSENEEKLQEKKNQEVENVFIRKKRKFNNLPIHNLHLHYQILRVLKISIFQ